MPRALTRWTFRIARIALAAYLGLILVLSQLQESLIFPGHSTQRQNSSIVRPTGTQQLIELHTPSGDTTYALFVPADRSPVPENFLPKAHGSAAGQLPRAGAPTIIFFYGNAMCLADTYSQIDLFHDLGCNVIVPDFVGYGMATGKPSETTLYQTATAVYDHLLQRDDIDHSKIIAAGWSLGAAVATDLAARKPLAGLITFSAFTSMPNLAAQLMPYLPVRAICKHHFDNAAKFPKIHCPILGIHGESDSMIPCQMTQTLAASVGAKVLLIPAANHNDLFEIGDALLRPALTNFIHATRRSTLDR
jgi:uncharacterized protein